MGKPMVLQSPILGPQIVGARRPVNGPPTGGQFVKSADNRRVNPSRNGVIYSDLNLRFLNLPFFCTPLHHLQPGSFDY